MSAAKAAVNPSLRLRLAVAGTAALLVALVVSFFGLSLLFERHVERRAAAELTLHLDQLIAALGIRERRLTLAREPADPRFARPLSGLYWQIESEGETLRSRSLWDTELVVPPLEPGAPASRSIDGPGGTSLLVIEREIVGGKRLGNRPVLLAVAIIRTDIEAATAEFRRDMLPYLALLASLFVAATVFQITIGLRPLGALRVKIAEIRRGTAQHMGGDFPAEILPLTRELDALVSSREAQIKRARAHAADFAHGLKTPLQALAGDVGRLRQRGEIELADDIQALTALMRRHVDRQLARARMAGQPVGRSNVAATIRRVVGVLERTPKGGVIDWRIDAPENLAARIDPEDLTEILGNILENAVRYAQTGVAIEASGDGAAIRIVIRDDGPGIPEAMIGHVLQRGGRLDETSGGAGLGLAIAHDIAAGAGGAIALANGDPGLAVTIRLSPAG
ncbi:MAG: HAMP domain-containing histidine kinase [Rhizobiaceae bacterium]|nr:HAMP domain-containing histidine kinase [Rhizobiaceae bacterium]